MKMSATYLAFLTMFLFLTSCGLDIEEGGTEAQDIKQSKTLIEDHSKVVGNYIGFVKNKSTGTEFKIRIELFVVYEQRDRDVYGRPRMFPVLKAYYQRLDRKPDFAETGSLNFTVRYMEENHSLILSDPVPALKSGFPVGYKPIFSFTGVLLNHEMTGLIYDHTGYVGEFHGKIETQKL